MQTPPIQLSHQNKLSNFLNQILLLDQKPLSDKAMGEKLLDIFSRIFGYNESALWIKRPSESSFFLAAYRVKDSVINSYNDGYCKLDPLNPVNIVGKTDILQKKNVITIKDIMPYDEFIKSQYYCDFLCKENYCHETVIYLRYKEEIIGCLGILKKKNEKDFTADELSFMDTLSYFLSEFTKKHFSVNSLMENMNLYESLSNQSPIGMIVFDINCPYTIRYINSAALRYTSEFINNLDIQAPGENFIARYIQKDISQFGVSKTIISQKNRPYFINAVPSQAVDSNYFKIYVYIVPQNGVDSIVKNTNIEANTNLTERQLEIINCILQGKSNNEIARELFISVNTVKTHLNNIYKELNVVNRLGLYSKLMINE